MGEAPAIARISWRPFAIPMRAAFSAAHGATTSREGVLVRLEAADGVTSLGEASPLPSYGGGSVAAVVDALPAVSSRLLAGLSHTLVAPESWRWPHAAGTPALPALACAVETALAAMAAARARQPLWRWLCGDAAGAPAPVIPVNGTIGAPTTAGAAIEAAAATAAGYRTLKLKVGIAPEDDARRVSAVRAAIGPDVALRLDANGAWGPVWAPARMAMARDAGVLLVEQPLPPGAGALAGMAALAREFAPVRVAADESCRTAADIEALAGTGLVAIVKPMVSGLAEAVRMLRRARDLGVECIVTTTLDAGVGTAAAMHLAALLPEPRLACGLATLALLEGDVVTGVPEVRHDAVTLPETLGLGVTIDEPALERFATAPWTTIT